MSEGWEGGTLGPAPELSMAEELQDDRPDHCELPRLPFMRRAWWVDKFDLAARTKWRKHGDASF